MVTLLCGMVLCPNSVIMERCGYSFCFIVHHQDTLQVIVYTVGHHISFTTPLVAALNQALYKGLYMGKNIGMISVWH